MKFGRLPPKRSHLIPPLAKYVRDRALAPPPASCPPPVLAWPMDMNDSIGDCTIAGVAHCIQRWDDTVLTDAQVLAAYEAIGGYNPADPKTDQGCAETDVLNTWMTTGIGGDVLAGYAALNVTDLSEIKDAINWFGCVYIGLNLPASAESNTSQWDVVPGSPIVGGHCVIIVGYVNDVYYIVSWGMLIPTTAAFLGQYMEEAYAPLSKDFVAHAGTTPEGLNWDALEADMAELKALA